MPRIMIKGGVWRNTEVSYVDLMLKPLVIPILTLGSHIEPIELQDKIIKKRPISNGGS